MHRCVFDALAEKQRGKGGKRGEQRAEETKEFVGILYEAIGCEDYRERMRILFKGRKHPMGEVEEMRRRFEEFGN